MDLLELLRYPLWCVSRRKFPGGLSFKIILVWCTGSYQMILRFEKPEILRACFNKPMKYILSKNHNQNQSGSILI